MRREGADVKKIQKTSTGMPALRDRRYLRHHAYGLDGYSILCLCIGDCHTNLLLPFLFPEAGGFSTKAKRTNATTSRVGDYLRPR